MITFLSKIFIKDNENTSLPVVKQAYGVLCGAVGILLNVLLFTGKFLIGTFIGSIAITADAFNNLSDAGSSVVTLIGFKLAGQKPDSEHPFGHGRMEYLSGFIVSIIIILMGTELLKTSIDKIMSPTEVQYSGVAILILGISILVKLYMAFYNTKIGKKINSVTMGAVAADSISDCLATALVLIVAVFSRFTSFHIDAYCGVAVALFILYTGIYSAKKTIDSILGQPVSQEFVKKIEQVVTKRKEILGIHDMLVHDYGLGRVMISLHAEVSSKADMIEIHDIIDNIEKEISDMYGCNAVIHMDPIETDNVEINTAREKIEDLVKVIDESITIHDFRMVKGPTHINVIFDVVVPYHLSLSDEEVKSKVARLVRSLERNYIAVINIDKMYT